MPRNELGSLRRSAAAALFGPGAVVDFRSEDAPVSAVAAGLDEWDRNFPPAGMLNEQTVNEVRLQKKLGVRGFRLPPSVPETFGRDEAKSLVAVRYPNWLQCPQCSRLGETRSWADEPGKPGVYCPGCTQKKPGAQNKVYVVPVRFVMACPDGHLDDFPWQTWVGHKADCKPPQFLSLTSERPGLAGLILSCPRCDSRRSMDRVFSEETWQTFPNCRGKRPWLAGADQSCSHKARAVQRGASNLYFPVVVSALSIPPWSDRLQEAMGVQWQQFLDVEPEDLATFVRIVARSPDLKPVLEDFGLSPAQFLAEITRRLGSHNEIDTDNLRAAEHRQFIGGLSDQGADREFEMRPQTVPEDVAPWFSHLVKVVRL